MNYTVTVRVTEDENVIDIPWEDIEKDFIEFIKSKADPSIRKFNLTVLKVVKSRIHCVFLDRCKKYLIQ